MGKLLTTLALAGICIFAQLTVVSGQPSAPLEPTQSKSAAVPSLAPVVRTVVPAVVSIAVIGREPSENPLTKDPFFRRFFGQREQQQERIFQATDSGVIVDAGRGYVLTNSHVVEKADRIVATLRDGRHLEAKLVGRDPETDLAVLRISGEGLAAVPLGDSDTIEVGDYVVAIGNPFGLGQTVTSGIVSAVGRMGLGVEGYEDFIQTDAAINPGNSGGALIDLNGRLIGINTAILAPAQGNIGIGFAVPINMARAVMDQLVQHGQVHRRQLGISVKDRADHDKPGATFLQGAVIADVAAGSNAEKAGLKTGDIILKVNGAPIRDAQHLRNRIGLLRIDQTVELEIERNGKTQNLTAKLGPRA